MIDTVTAPAPFAGLDVNPRPPLGGVWCRGVRLDCHLVLTPAMAEAIWGRQREFLRRSVALPTPVV